MAILPVLYNIRFQTAVAFKLETAMTSGLHIPIQWKLPANPNINAVSHIL
jgi:hypothetical protein